MKKTLIAVAALAATGAFAQVSVYGRLDVGYGNYKTTATAGAATLETKRNGVQSGSSASSMWGIQGSEDLGGGMKAMFKLEQDLYPSNGTNSVGGSTGAAGSAGFNRISIVGVSGAFGTVALGRDYVPTFKLAAATDVMSQSRIDTVQLASAVGSTVPDLIHYSTPNMSGFQLNVAYGNSDNTVSPSTGDSTVKNTNVSATYTNGPLFVGLATGSSETKAAGADASASYFGISATDLGLAGNVTKTSANVLGASYNFGTFTVAGNIINAKATTAAGDLKANEMNIGATMPMGKVTLRAQIGTNSIEVAGAEDFDGNDLAVGAEYALSAKTALFAKTGTMGKMSDSGASVKTTGTAVGIRTVF